MLGKRELASWPQRCLLGLLVAVAAALLGVRAAEEKREPVYVGARVCAQCHHDQAGGDQYSRWLLSRHSVAFAVLAKPEAK